MSKKFIYLALIVFVVAILGFGYFRFIKTNSAANMNSGLTGEERQKNIDQQVEVINVLTQSVIAKSTRDILNLLNSTSSKKVDELWQRPELSGVKKYLTKEKINSKFVAINGSELEGVGSQIFILFPSEPDAIFRVSYQYTNSTSSPLALVKFVKSEDTPETISEYLKIFGPALAAKNIGI